MARRAVKSSEMTIEESAKEYHASIERLKKFYPVGLKYNKHKKSKPNNWPALFYPGNIFIRFWVNFISVV
jgi:hypothetical protein